MPKLVFFYSPNCGACRMWEPVVRKVAEQRGWHLQKVNIDECKTDKCKQIGFTPALELDGRSLSLAELRKIAEKV